MGCEASKALGQKSDNTNDMHIVYPSALNNIDEEILYLWKKFLRGDCTRWKELVDSGVVVVSNGQYNISPAVFWGDKFKAEICNNVATTHPLIALELETRPIKVSARILCGIMEFCLINIVTDEQHIERKHELEKIAKHHCKWNVDDASYITVENAMMDAMRICLGYEFTPQIEVRLRYKYAKVKKLIQKYQNDFETNNIEEAQKLKKDGLDRINSLKELSTTQMKHSFRNLKQATVLTMSDIICESCHSTTM